MESCNSPPERLQRAGSGTSAVLDPPEAGGCAEAAAESRKLPSSQYKGVVPQPNGRWGAQIYEKHRRVWLGTFNAEAEAAAAYDVAAQRFRGRESITNFEPLSDSPAAAAELAFIQSRSKAEIVDMLRKHTYPDELEQSRSSSGAAAAPHMTEAFAAAGDQERESLFEKSVTPSDVGKLNRLVIPKQHAEKHFPLHEEEKGSALLSLVDGCGKVWRFRYSYWNSSQSYVLTKGWSRFVKEKGLKAGDVVSFMRSTGPERQLYIDRRPSAAAARPAGPVVMLFGVNICKFPMGVRGDGEEGKKRRRESHETSHLFQRQRLGAYL